jgi:heme-degrading monooxygenase HmoA
MHLRATTVHADPASIDDGVAFLRQKVMHTLQTTHGCLGLSMLADRHSGRCIAATAWETEEAMRASEDPLQASRSAFALSVGADRPEVHPWEIALVHREHPAGDGAGAQVAWARIQPTHLDHLVDAYRENLMPKLSALPGFCSLSFMIDRHEGRTVSVTCFEDAEALNRVRKEARSMREQFAQAMGARIVDVAEMELALAHLGVPETV